MKRTLYGLVLAAGLVVGSAALAGAISLSVAPNQTAVGGMTDICVFAAGNGGKDGTAVALQVDLGWDDRCVMPLLNERGQPRCIVNPATGKSLLTRLQSSSTRAILLSITSQSPIPDGQLFCCSFSVSEIPPSSNCMFNLAGASGSKSDSTRIGGIATQGAVLMITGLEADPSTRTTGGAGPIVPLAPQPLGAAPQPESPPAAADPAPAPQSDTKNTTTTGTGAFAAPRTPGTSQELPQDSGPAPAAVAPDEAASGGDTAEIQGTPEAQRKAGTPTVAAAKTSTTATTPSMQTPTPAAKHTPTAATPAIRPPQS